jgi:hypothetical protein
MLLRNRAPLDVRWVPYEEGRQGNPKWVDLLLHCDLGGRPTLLPVFERAHYALGFEGVWFARRRDLARWVLDLET